MSEEKSHSEEVRQQIIGYITAAFGLVAGLAWNEAIKGLIDMVVPIGTSGLVAKFVYATIVTLILVAVSFILLRKKK